MTVNKEKIMKEGRYGKWAGNPDGHPEDKRRCIKEVFDCGFKGFIPRQCRRKRGHGPDGLYCKQHAEKIEGTDARE